MVTLSRSNRTMLYLLRADLHNNMLVAAGIAEHWDVRSFARKPDAKAYSLQTDSISIWIHMRTARLVCFATSIGIHSISVIAFRTYECKISVWKVVLIQKVMKIEVGYEYSIQRRIAWTTSRLCHARLSITWPVIEFLYPTQGRPRSRKYYVQWLIRVWSPPARSFGAAKFSTFDAVLYAAFPEKIWSDKMSDQLRVHRSLVKQTDWAKTPMRSAPDD